MKNKITVKTITGTALLSALVVIFQIIGNYVQIVPSVCLNLALIPIAIGAILFGPYAGAFLGFIDGICVLFAPSTIGVFMAMTPIGTVVTCLFKTTIAGLVSGFVYKPFKNKHQTLGCIIASLLIPIINTGLFSGFAFLFFKELLNSTSESGSYPNLFITLIFGILGWNFVFEFSITAVLSSAISRIVLFVQNKRN